MASQWSKTVAILNENKLKLQQAWVEGQLSDSRIRRALMNEEEVRRFCQPIIDMLLPAMAADSQGEPDSPVYSPLTALLTRLAEQRQQQGFSAFEIAVAVISLKDHCLPFVQTAYRDQTSQLVAEYVSVCKLVDTLGVRMLESLLRKSAEQIKKQAEDILELSTPVVQIWEGVVVTPLIGSLDSQRTQQFMERLLERIVETNSPVAIVDITGVPTIDTKTAQHLVETVSAVKLLGAQVILTGVRPAIAQTLVHLGVDMPDIVTRSSLAAGLRIALEALDLKVVSKNGQP